MLTPRIASMPEHFPSLGPRAQRGSKPRCHLMTHGAPEEVAGRLTALIAPWGLVNRGDQWMPEGFGSPEEAQLHQSPRLLPPQLSEALRTWWLEVPSPRSATPNWDIASTCTVRGTEERGLLLVEAKAHEHELNGEEAAKPAQETASGRRNHERIGRCIQQANLALTAATGRSWRLSHRSHYQMSNRFAWACKLAELGVPVILVYLGFLQADEMKPKGRPFANKDEWEQLVRSHSATVFPGDTWDRTWTVAGQPLVPLIRTTTVNLGDGRLEVSP